MDSPGLLADIHLTCIISGVRVCIGAKFLKISTGRWTDARNSRRIGTSAAMNVTSSSLAFGRAANIATVPPEKIGRAKLLDLFGSGLALTRMANLIVCLVDRNIDVAAQSINCHRISIPPVVRWSGSLPLLRFDQNPSFAPAELSDFLTRAHSAREKIGLFGPPHLPQVLSHPKCASIRPLKLAMPEGRKLPTWIVDFGLRYNILLVPVLFGANIKVAASPTKPSWLVALARIHIPVFPGLVKMNGMIALFLSANSNAFVTLVPL